MKSAPKGFLSIDEYIASAPEAAQPILEEVRKIVRAAAPDAVETIAYQMPAFKMQGTLVYFAAWKKHIGFYPASGAVPDVFKEQLAGYDGTSGSIHFPFDKPMPAKLITDIVKYRIIEDKNFHEAKALEKKLKAEAKKKKDKPT